jgi:hypothetical protein
MPTGACSRGYKLRSREGVCPKSLSMVESSKCSVGVFLRGVWYAWNVMCDRVGDLVIF